jgi:hypothetical protein
MNSLFILCLSLLNGQQELCPAECDYEVQLCILCVIVQFWEQNAGQNMKNVEITIASRNRVSEEQSTNDVSQ